MRAESTPSRLLLVPLAFGIVEVAIQISTPTSTTPVVVMAPVVVIEESVPVKRIVVEQPPALPLEPECRGCVRST